MNRKTRLKSCWTALSLALISGLLTACVPSELTYQPPTPVSIQTEARTAEKYEKLWRHYISKLSADFYQIEHTDSDSGLISVSFYSNKPQEFVECGQSNRTYQHFDEKINYIYDPAEPTAYNLRSANGTIWQVQRQPEIHGKANIVMTQEGELVRVKTHVRYTLNIRQQMESAWPRQREFVSDVQTFSSEQPYAGPQLKCQSKGVLEKQLLSYVE